MITTAHNLLLQVKEANPLVLDGRFTAGNLLSVGSQGAIAFADSIIRLGELRFKCGTTGLNCLDLRVTRIDPFCQGIQSLLVVGKGFRQILPIR